MPTLREDAETVADRQSAPADYHCAAARLARAILNASRIGCVSENCLRLAIVDADHYEALLARNAAND